MAPRGSWRTAPGPSGVRPGDDHQRPRQDAQAGIELPTTGLWGMLAGVELVHNAGMISLKTLLAAEVFVLASQVILFLIAT